MILPRREYPRLLHRLLHDRTSRAIAAELRDEPHVDVVLVPYRLRDRPGHPPARGVHGEGLAQDRSSVPPAMAPAR